MEIVLDHDLSINNTININENQDISIDLNGYNIHYNGSEYLFNINGGILKINDSTIDKYYTISSEEVDDIGNVSQNDNEIVYYSSIGRLDGTKVSRTNIKHTIDISNIEKAGKLEANSAKAVIYLDNGAKLNIDGGHIINPDGKNGVMANNGIVTMINGCITNCGSYNESGGAIYSKSGNLIIHDGLFLNNKGKQGGALRTDSWVGLYVSGGVYGFNTSKYNGGAIYTTDTIEIHNSIFVGNKADEGGGAIYSFMQSAGTGKINIDDSEFHENSSVKTGGAIHIEHQGLGIKDNCIENTHISNNESTNGGGIYIKNSCINIDNSEVSFNKASENGSGIYYDSYELNILDNNTILGNSIYDKGNGGLYISDNCLMEHEWVDKGEINVGTFDELIKAIDSIKKYEKGTINIISDITFDDSITITDNKDITILLNGHTLRDNTSNDSLIKVKGKSSSLRLKNTKDEEVGKFNITETLIGDIDSEESGKSSTYNKSEGIIEYYVTKSEAESDKIHTKETLYKYTLKIEDNIGKILTENKDSILEVDGGSLIVDNGIISNINGNHGVLGLNGANIEINGGYILENGCGNSIKPDEDINNDFSIEKAGAGIYCGDNTRLKVNNGVIAHNSAVKSGGGICSRYSKSCEINGGIIVGNIANNFGGGISLIDIENKVIIGDEDKDEQLIISGNIAHSMQRPSIENTPIRVNRRYGGAGIFSDTDTLVDGGYITHNFASGETIKIASGVDDGGGTGGGGIFASNKLEIANGFITSNKANASGGGIYSYSGKYDDSGALVGDIKLHGGIIACNQSIKGEAGGLRVDNTGEIIAESNKIVYITNNSTDTQTNWGGGGIFNSSGAFTCTENIVVVDNESIGFGGGMGGCNHGINKIFMLNGGGIFDNIAHGDPNCEKISGYEEHLVNKISDKNYADKVDARTKIIEGNNSTKFIDYKFGGDSKGSYQDFYCSNISDVSGTMLAQGDAKWTGSGSSSQKTLVDPIGHPLRINKGEKAEETNMIGLTAHPSEEDKINAINKANVIISGNKSSAHGAGIMSNGRFEIGINTDEPTIGPGKLIITKEVLDENNNKVDTDEIFSFKLILRGIDKNELVGPYMYDKYPFDVTLDKDVDATGESIVGISSGDVITLRNRQTIRIKDLPDGEYHIIELKADKFEVEFIGGSDGIIHSDKNKEVKIINRVKEETPSESSSEPSESSSEPSESSSEPSESSSEPSESSSEPSESSSEPEDSSSKPSESSSEPEDSSSKPSESSSEPEESSSKPSESSSEPSESSSEPEESSSPEESSEVETTKPDTPPNGGGGGGNNNDEPSTSYNETSTEDITLEESSSSIEESSSIVDESSEEPSNQSEEYRTELPNPNDPNSPYEIVIYENGIPKTYIKVYDEDKEEYLYIYEEDVPRFGLPKTIDTTKDRFWHLIFNMSFIGLLIMCCLEVLDRQKNRK